MTKDEEVEELVNSITGCLGNVSDLPLWMQSSALGRDTRPLLRLVARAVIESDWLRDRPKHDVKFHIGTGTVVCSCGAYFETEKMGVTVPKTAVAQWAEHIR